ncbi:MAG: anaerobic glycerol-3-phosphate dehydrogenase subunit A [Anaerolineae bacterium]|nr:anaerobic glycerol-3-phosphate dehydrogenase subunit A [Anaerolineae bacterium]
MESHQSMDVIVIGGGATGAAAIYDLARRGVKALLVEQLDLSTGTSGRYHGLLHSGGRYAGGDLETARECIEENRVLRRIAPFAIEDTGGLFVATPDDPADFPAAWRKGCADVGIPAESLTPAEVRALEPALTPRITEVYRVPDGSCDSFDLIHAFIEAARSFGAEALIYHEVIDLQRDGDSVVGARLRDTCTGAVQTVRAACVLNAAGPWAGRVAGLAGMDVNIHFDRGAMIAMNTRWVNTIINRLRPATDGDILVPVGTVCVLGTTSVHTDQPDDYRIEAWEIGKILGEADVVVPGIRQGRALRAWAGVRPLYEPSEANHDDDIEGRAVRRTFSVLDHARRDGLRGLVTVVGGKLTTCRLMAEHAVDAVCAQLGIDTPCTTADEVLPVGIGGSPEKRYHHLDGRLRQLERGHLPGELVCECEMVTRSQVEAAIAAYGDQPVSLDDLRRDLRLGMGPCQAGFCAVRAAGILHQVRRFPGSEATEALGDFVNERFRGVRPLLWGHQLRQFYLDESIYRRILGLDRLLRHGSGLDLDPNQGENEGENADA